VDAAVGQMVAANFTSALALWFLGVTVAALAVGIAVWVKTSSDLLAGFAFVACYWVAFAFGSPIALWLAIVMTLMALGGLLTFKTMRREYS
jgi:hypothetical protein